MLTRLHETLILAKIRFDDDNPLNGLKPNFDFGGDANGLWKRILGAAWGLAIIGIIGWAFAAGYKMSVAQENERDHAAGKRQLTRALTSLAIVVGMPIIVGAIILLIRG